MIILNENEELDSILEDMYLEGYYQAMEEMENPVARYKAKKAAEAKAAEDAEVEKRLGKRPEVLATNDNIKKIAKRMAIAGGALGAASGIRCGRELNKLYPGQGYSATTGGLVGGVGNALQWGAIGYGRKKPNKNGISINKT